MTRPPNRIRTVVISFLIGLISGSLATVGHRGAVAVGDISIPTGLIAALVGVAALLLGLRLVAGGRSAAAAAAAGIIVAVAVLTLPGPGGSVLIVGDLTGTVWSIAPALIAVLVVAWPKLPSSRPSDA